MVKIKDTQFCENEKKKRTKKLTFRSGDLNPGFLSIIPTHNLNFEGDGIKSRRGSKNFSTLLNYKLPNLNLYELVAGCPAKIERILFNKYFEK